jgi:protein-L-isoaspartate(D-aspartate) O-methyltransferase
MKMADFDTARFNMVESQIRPNKVSDPRIIEVLEEVPREAFFPEAMRPIAYADRSLKIGEGRYILDPMVFARLLQALDIGPMDLVLDIACGTGYSTAVVARLASTVVALESEPAMVVAANKILNDLGIDNAVVIEGDLAGGYSDQAPYDAIMINGAVDEIPKHLSDQLADGGRLAAVMIDDQGLGRAVLMRKSSAGLSRLALFDATVPKLPQFSREIGFVF